MDVLEESWDAVVHVRPELSASFEALCTEGQAADLSRFQKFGKDEGVEIQQYLMGPAGRVPRLMTGVAGLLLVAFVLGALLGIAAPSLFWAAAAVGVALVVAGGIMSVRIAAKRGFDHLFQNPEMSCEHVWVAATDAACALALQGEAGAGVLDRLHLDHLTTIWRDSGLPLEILQPPPTYRLAA